MAEGDLTIGEVLGVDVEIHPELSSGRWHGKHVISLINASNLDVDVSLTGSDRDSQLAFLADPGVLHLRSGGLATPNLSVKARHPVLRGVVQRHAFEVRAVSRPAVGSRAEEAGTDSVSSTASGTFLQRPILPRGSILAATLAVAAIVAVVVAAALLRGPAPPSSELASGLPATPDLTVIAVDGHSLSMSWQAQPLVEHFRLHSVTPDGRVFGVSEIDGAVELLEVPGLTPATSYCFQLQAARSASSSALSPIRCAMTSASDASSRSSSAPSAAGPSASAEVDGANPEAAAAAEAAKQVAAAVAAIAGSATSTDEADAASGRAGSSQAQAQAQGQAHTLGSTSVPANRTEPTPAQQTVQTSRSPVVTSAASGTRWPAVGPIIQVEDKIKGYAYSFQGIGTGSRTETIFHQDLRPPAPAGKHFLVVALEIRSLATDRPIIAPYPFEFDYIYSGCGSRGCELPLALETDFFPDPPGQMVRPPLMGSSDVLLEPVQKYIVILSAMVDDEVTVDAVRLRAGGPGSDAILSLSDIPSFS